MKRVLLFIMTMVFGFAVIAQNTHVGEGFLSKRVSHSFKPMMKTDMEPANLPVIGQSSKVIKHDHFKGTDVVSVIKLGSSANGYSYGYRGGQKNILAVNNVLNTVTNIHRMGGVQDPGGHSGDLGYDISTDGGMTWTNMVECYVATNNAGGNYFLDAARYPANGIYNPIGNTDPDQAYVHFFAPVLDISNSDDPASGFGGYGFGRAKIGDPADTTKNLTTSIPAEQYFQYIPDAYTMTNTGEWWAAEPSFDWTSGTAIYTNNEILVTHGVWDESSERFIHDYFYLELQVVPEIYGPIFTKVEFSPDGQIGYIVVLADDGQVSFPQPGQRGFYPILFRTEDGGQTWSDPIDVTISGEDGIEGVLNYLSDEELAQLYEPVPPREELVFTTGFDFDLSVDNNGNPQIAVFITLNLETNYSYYYGRIAPNGYSIGAPFLLSSTNLGEEGSWIGYNVGRAYNYTHDFGPEYPEMNRVQIARTSVGDKMFVSWADTDTTMSPDANSAPDIWVRGVNMISQTMTLDAEGSPMPVNVTFGSEAWLQAYFFAMGNEVFYDGIDAYTIPFSYQITGSQPNPDLPVEYYYIPDFKFYDNDFPVGINEAPIADTDFIKVSQTIPNPANSVARFNVTLAEATMVNVTVTNMMGQTVQALPANRLQAGVNELQINVSNLSSGVYFYTVEAGKEAVTKKMIVK